MRLSKKEPEMESDYPFGIIIAALITICFLGALAVALLVPYKQRKFIKENSKKYHETRELEKRYAQYADAATTKHLNVTLNSLNKFQSFDPNAFILDEMNSNAAYYRQYVTWCEHCRHIKKEYDALVSLIYQQPCASMNKLPEYLTWKTFMRLEHQLMNKSLLVIPTDFVIEVHWNYRSPAGRNSYFATELFGCDGIKHLLHQKVNEQRHRATAQYQRSLMTPTLRTKILERDGRRCVICGASASDGVKLHIDHIVPIAKGGKTIESNLRVLCDQCNLGKSDKLLSRDTGNYW
jgi:5-methylcytosine-specific restriction endonuclease McrA